MITQALIATTTPSPLGDILIVASQTGVTHTWFVDGPAERALHRACGDEPAAWGANEHTDALTAQLQSYFAGTLREFTVPLTPRGAGFQHRVWDRLCAIPYGRTTSYGAIARALGDPGAARAVGAANAANPIAIVIPCHRVIDARGSLHGYAGGLERKRFLLDLERAMSPLFASAT